MGKKKVLIVDDDDAGLDLLKIKLGDTSELITTSEPQTALELAINTKPDIILSDIVMPVLDGGDLSIMFLECEATKHIPFVYITSVVSPQEVANFNGYVGGRRGIAKSTPAKEMISMIGKILEGQSSL